MKVTVNKVEESNEVIFEKGKLYISKFNELVLCTLNTPIEDGIFPGVCINDPHNINSVGKYSIRWNVEVFKEFKGVVTLKQ
jgi:hypothetical protein